MSDVKMDLVDHPSMFVHNTISVKEINLTCVKMVLVLSIKTHVLICMVVLQQLQLNVHRMDFVLKPILNVTNYMKKTPYQMAVLYLNLTNVALKQETVQLNLMIVNLRLNVQKVKNYVRIIHVLILMNNVRNKHLIVKKDNSNVLITHAEINKKTV